MKERNKAIPASYLILKKGNKVLMLRRANTTYFDGYYSLPAGHVEAGELPTQCMVREAKEEIGVTLKTKDLILMCAIYRATHDKTGDRIDFFFVFENSKVEPKNMEPHKCDDMRWVSLDKLPSKITPEVKKALDWFKKKYTYYEMPFEKKNLNPTKNIK